MSDTVGLVNGSKAGDSPGWAPTGAGNSTSPAARARNVAISARVTWRSGQNRNGAVEQPAVTRLAANASMSATKVWPSPTSANPASGPGLEVEGPHQERCHLTPGHIVVGAVAQRVDGASPGDSPTRPADPRTVRTPCCSPRPRTHPKRWAPYQRRPTCAPARRPSPSVAAVHRDRTVPHRSQCRPGPPRRREPRSQAHEHRKHPRTRPAAATLWSPTARIIRRTARHDQT